MSVAPSEPRAVAPGSRSRLAVVAGWVPRIVLAVVFVAAGAAKLAGEPAMLQLFDDIGAGQGLRFLVGACEVAGAIGLLVPRLAGLAAIGLALVMIGATITNVLLGNSPALTLLLLAVAVLVVALRRRHLNPFAQRPAHPSSGRDQDR